MVHYKLFNNSIKKLIFWPDWWSDDDLIDEMKYEDELFYDTYFINPYPNPTKRHINHTLN